MNCPNCGTSNLDNATICINCGRSLGPAPVTPPVTQSYTPPPPSAPYGGTSSAAATGPTIPNYLIQSILVTFCCCLPFGIVAIIFAAQVNSKLAAGDRAGALEASRKAKMWTWIALGTGLLVWIVMMTVWGAAIANAIREGNFS